MRKIFAILLISFATFLFFQVNVSAEQYYKATYKIIKKSGSGSSSINGSWQVKADSESEAMSKTKKHIESSYKLELENGYVIEDLIVKPK